MKVTFSKLTLSKSLQKQLNVWMQVNPKGARSGLSSAVHMFAEVLWLAAWPLACSGLSAGYVMFYLSKQTIISFLYSSVRVLL